MISSSNYFNNDFQKKQFISQLKEFKLINIYCVSDNYDDESLYLHFYFLHNGIVFTSHIGFAFDFYNQDLSLNLDLVISASRKHLDYYISKIDEILFNKNINYEQKEDLIEDLTIFIRSQTFYAGIDLHGDYKGRFYDQQKEYCIDRLKQNNDLSWVFTSVMADIGLSQEIVINRLREDCNFDFSCLEANCEF